MIRVDGFILTNGHFLPFALGIKSKVINTGDNAADYLSSYIFISLPMNRLTVAEIFKMFPNTDPQGFLNIRPGIVFSQSHLSPFTFTTNTTNSERPVHPAEGSAFHIFNTR